MQVILKPVISISGHVSSDSGDWNGIRISLHLSAGGRRLADTSYGAIGGLPAVNPDGTFTLNNVIGGEYRLSVFSPSTHYVKEARYDGADVLNGPLHVSSSTSQDLEIVLSSQTGEILGTVIDSSPQAVHGVQIVLVPDEHRDRADLYKTATSDDAGSFTLRGIAPGNYRLFAWKALEPYSYYDDSVLARFEHYATPLSLTESSSASAQVRLIPDGN